MRKKHRLLGWTSTASSPYAFHGVRWGKRFCERGFGVVVGHIKKGLSLIPRISLFGLDHISSPRTRKNATKTSGNSKALSLSVQSKNKRSKIKVWWLSPTQKSFENKKNEEQSIIIILHPLYGTIMPPFLTADNASWALIPSDDEINEQEEEDSSSFSSELELKLVVVRPDDKTGAFVFVSRDALQSFACSSPSTKCMLVVLQSSNKLP